VNTVEMRIQAYAKNSTQQAHMCWSGCFRYVVLLGTKLWVRNSHLNSWVFSDICFYSHGQG